MMRCRVKEKLILLTRSKRNNVFPVIPCDVQPSYGSAYRAERRIACIYNTHHVMTYCMHHIQQEFNISVKLPWSYFIAPFQGSATGLQTCEYILKNTFRASALLYLGNCQDKKCLYN